MHFATGKLTYDRILKEIELMKSKGLLIAGKYNGLLTTKKAIKNTSCATLFQDVIAPQQYTFNFLTLS